MHVANCYTADQTRTSSTEMRRAQAGWSMAARRLRAAGPARSSASAGHGTPVASAASSKLAKGSYSI